MRKTMLLVTAMALALVLGSGVALAATIVGTNGPDNKSGTSGSTR